jgi:hypothetical protein
VEIITRQRRAAVTTENEQLASNLSFFLPQSSNRRAVQFAIIALLVQVHAAAMAIVRPSESKSKERWMTEMGKKGVLRKTRHSDWRNEDVKMICLDRQQLLEVSWQAALSGNKF